MKRVTCFSLLLLSACAAGPDYRRPLAATPAAFKEGGIQWKKAQPESVSLAGWWKIFGDPQLNALEAQVVISNQNIKAAEASYRQARALVAVARSAYFPSVTASASTARGNAGTTYDAALDVVWEIDVWGRIRRTVEAGEAAAQTSAADLAAARLSAQADLATDYLQLRVTDAQSRLLSNTVTAYTKSLQLTQNQYAAGVAGRADVVQAETQLASARAQATDIGVQRAQLEHAIALLVGKPPASFSIAPSPEVPPVPEIPPGLPSALLERRPDIAGAERAMAAANAQIGVAEAAFFPDLTLPASGGFTDHSFAHWFSLPNRLWAVAPTLAETLFDAGLRSAQVAGARATYDQSVATYRQTVLAAFQQVEDNLAAQRILKEETTMQNTAVASSQQSVRLTTNQYKAGTVSYLNIVTAQAIEYNNENASLTILGRRLTAAVTLIKALGGGWNAAEMDNPPLEKPHG
ncbi:MAG: efflux transporter outer membrane subunit [Pseudomonadota bacterium]|nr:efflux transporter outer membrane subunit [Pseudomonadota bacterium]MDE3038617.1 efflux transporter outer membrane subunit [Pseudomonadota bacterium]